MTHIKLEDDNVGIRSLIMYRPDTGKPLYELVQILLRSASLLSFAERGLIATYVSNKNTCSFCMIANGI